MQITAAHIRFEEIPDPRVHGTIGGPESVIVDVEELFERLTYRYAGRRFRLTDIYGQVVSGLLA